MRKAIFVMLALAATASLGTGAAFAAPADAGGEAPYPADDVFRALNSMDLFMTLDEDYHMVVDEVGAGGSPGITEADIAIALGYAAHNDAVIDAAAANQQDPDDEISPEVWATIRDLENGRFGNVFDWESNGDQLLDQTTAIGDAAGLLVFIYHLVYLY